MMLLIPRRIRMWISKLWKLHLIVPAILLAAIVIPPLAVLGLTIFDATDPTPTWYQTVATILLMFTVAANCILSMKLIRTLKPSLNGGKAIYTEHSKNLE